MARITLTVSRVRKQGERHARDGVEETWGALEWTELPDRQPGPGEIRVKVSACGVCRTDLHVVDGELPDPQVPIIPGHEIVGRIDAIGVRRRGTAASASESAFRGWATPAASVPIA